MELIIPEPLDSSLLLLEISLVGKERDIERITMAVRIFISGSTPLMAAFFSFVSLWSPVNFIFIYIGLIMIPVTARVG